MSRPFPFEVLESRQLLAVSVTKTNAGDLVLTGNSASDVVDVEGTGVAGQMEVFVNGVSVGVFNGVKNIRGNLGAGNDTVNIAAVQIPGYVKLDMGAGADRVDFDNTTNLSLAPDGNVSIGKYVTLSMGRNAGDEVDWDTDSGALGISVGSYVDIVYAADVDLNGNGGSSAIEATDISIAGNLKITISKFGDTNGDTFAVDLDDVNVGQVTSLAGSEVADRMRIMDSRFVGAFGVNLGNGNDFLDVDNGAGDGNFFGAKVTYNGSNGADTVDDSAVVNIYTKPPTFFLVEATV
jgi:hypothetical protein